MPYAMATTSDTSGLLRLNASITSTAFSGHPMGLGSILQHGDSASSITFFFVWEMPCIRANDLHFHLHICLYVNFSGSHCLRASA